MDWIKGNWEMAKLMRGLLALAVLLALAPAASATVVYGDFSGTNVDFLGVQETSTFGPPTEQLFDAPIVLGDQLLFFPTNFSANSANGGVTQVGSQLQATIMATNGTTLTNFSITEFGDTTLTGVGTAATGTFGGLGGTITVLEVNGVPTSPTFIPITPDNAFFTLTANPGLTNWSLTTTVDIGSAVPGATKVFLSFDNNLVASSEAGTSSSIQKKVVNGPAVVITVPEPGLFTLLVGTLVLGVRRRS